MRQFNPSWQARREAQQRKGKGSKEEGYRCGNVGHYGCDPKFSCQRKDLQEVRRC